MNKMTAAPELRAIATAIVRRYENRLRRGCEPAGKFLLRIAPSDAQYRKGRLGLGGYDPRDIRSVNAFVKAVETLHAASGCEVVRMGAGELKGVRADPHTVEACFRILGVDRSDYVVESLEAILRDALRKLPSDSWPSAWVELELSDLESDGIGVMRRWGSASSLCTFLSILRCYSSADKPLWKRVLSIHACGDSKAFENEWQTTFIAAARKAGAISDSCDDADAMARLGFLRFPSFATLAGTGEFDLGAIGRIKIGSFGASGIQLPDDALAGLRDIQGVDAAIVAENETNFHALAAANLPGLLLIYGGGQPNSATMTALGRIDSVLPSAIPVRAWSDIDLGGFEIVARIMNGCPRARPLLMDACDFDVADAAGLRLPRSPEYVAMLDSYRESHPESPFSEVCDRCTSARATIEQEAFLAGAPRSYALRHIERLLRHSSGDTGISEKEPARPAVG